MKEASSLEKSGHLTEAREKYAESQALYETGEASDAIKRLDQEIKNRVKDSLGSAHKLYEQHKFKEAAAALEETIKLGPDQSVLAYDLALCYYQLGDRVQAAEYLRRSALALVIPNKDSRLFQLLAFVTTGENGSPAGKRDRERIDRLNRSG